MNSLQDEAREQTQVSKQKGHGVSYSGSGCEDLIRGQKRGTEEGEGWVAREYDAKETKERLGPERRIQGGLW